MKREVKQITIKHHSFGEITIHTEIEQKYYEKIGQPGDGGGIKGIKHFNGNVFENENGTFSIKNLLLFQSKNFIVGWHRQGVGVQSSSVYLYVNLPVDDNNFVIYPNAVLSVVYK